MMSKPKYIVILTGLFCSVVAGVLHTFTRFFVNVLARVDFFGMTTMAFGLGKPSPDQKSMKLIISDCELILNNCAITNTNKNC